MKYKSLRYAGIIFTTWLAVMPAGGQSHAQTHDCDFSEIPGAVWWGTKTEMTVREFASHLAPIFWFSPDEPSLNDAHGAAIATPEPFPFQTADGPVVYYQLKELLWRASEDTPAYSPDPTDHGAGVIDFTSAALMVVEFYAYFAEESGLGSHQHDVEPVEFKVGIARSDGEYLRDNGFGGCDERHYVILVTRVSGKAHGIEWFWNVLEVDEGTRFPMTVLVEEGKHALATDKNGDGYFTPAYDVNVRINDAWGVRDIISSGGLFTGGYQAWMTKVRHPADRVMPPLPPDSPLRPEGLERHSEYAHGNAVYELRPLPRTSAAAAYDAQQGEGSHLVGFLADKEVPDAPKQKEFTSLDEAFSWVEAGSLKRSLSLALYADGDVGFSWVFPFFVVRNLNLSMSGGYLMHRMYLTGKNLSDFGWMAMYTPSASRWIDTYFAAGAEWQKVSDNGGSRTRADFVLETGLKLRAQVGHSPLKFLSVLTDFWGVRFGLKNYGFFDIDRLTYVVEFGAGSF